ncbi:uncharacterized protein FOMMEDRAFT_16803 [Fomitiporia mediterranea MF3/22]|uniref:uncharacterized protein n=1 Tax=Fomitiporia mediterranea (strain MF3/22) TaxID=694068 RepID=UPI00044074D4|nr:uncharacterized protein FOMMEDRAFT_16803 [Fomitiporia mediterranea MF3/22]EJD08442.1 hypothetical protein FOMMEDRAFT_16803 [Fomitiporia mediterranea MF3/22]
MGSVVVGTRHGHEQEYECRTEKEEGNKDADPVTDIYPSELERSRKAPDIKYSITGIANANIGYHRHPYSNPQYKR